MTTPSLTLNDGYRIPQLGLGTWQITGSNAVKVVGTALEAGYRHLDTAAAYGNEREVGRAIRASGIPREHLFVTTKLDTSDMGRTREALEASLERLGLDHVDLYLIHWPVPRHRQRFDAWDAMQQARTNGLVRSIGVSNFTVRHLQEFLDRGGVVPAINQIEYHPTYQQRGLQDFAATHGTITEAYSPLGMGSAVGAEAITAIAQRHGTSPAQVILRWHLHQGRVAIPKASTPQRLADNLAAATQPTLMREEMDAIDALNTGRYLGWDPDSV